MNYTGTDIGILSAKKIEKLQQLLKRAKPDEKEIYEFAIVLTRQSVVVSRRICRVLKISPNENDERRVIAGQLKYGNAEEEGNGVGFPQIRRGAAFSSEGKIAQESYEKITNYRNLSAMVKSDVDPVAAASISPQAINLVVLLKTEILRPTVIDSEKIGFMMDLINENIKQYGPKAIEAVAALMQHPRFYGDIGGKILETVSDVGTEYIKLQMSMGKFEKLHKTMSKYFDLAKFTVNWYKYNMALSDWVFVGNKMLDFVDPDGEWSYRDFHGVV